MGSERLRTKMYVSRMRSRCTQHVTFIIITHASPVSRRRGYNLPKSVLLRRYRGCCTVIQDAAVPSHRTPETAGFCDAHWAISMEESERLQKKCVTQKKRNLRTNSHHQIFIRLSRRRGYNLPSRVYDNTEAAVLPSYIQDARNCCIRLH